MNSKWHCCHKVANDDELGLKLNTSIILCILKYESCVYLVSETTLEQTNK
jgi:hypothetical protein